MPFEVANYLYALARRLHLDPAEKDEIIQELEAHLEDKTAELETQGVDHDTAMVFAYWTSGCAPGSIIRFMALLKRCHSVSRSARACCPLVVIL